MTLCRCVSSVCTLAESSSQAARRAAAQLRRHQRYQSTLQTPLPVPNPTVQTDSKTSLLPSPPKSPRRTTSTLPRAAVQGNASFDRQLTILKQALSSNDVARAIAVAVPSVKKVDYEVSAKLIDPARASQYISTLLRTILESPPETASTVLQTLVNGPDQHLLREPNMLLQLLDAAISQPEYFADVLLALAPPDPLPERDVVDAPFFLRMIPSLLAHGVPEQAIAIRALKMAQEDISVTNDWSHGAWDFLIQASGSFANALDILDLAKMTPKFARVPDEEMDTVTARRIARCYTAAMLVWIKESSVGRQSARIRSSVPSQLARDLSTQIGEKHLPANFLNAWMNAEGLATNYASADLVWRLFDLRSPSVPDLFFARLPQSMSSILLRARPTASTWRAYFKLHKNLPSFKGMRHAAQAMFGTIALQDVTTGLLNSLLSALNRTADIDDSPLDIALLLTIMRLFDWDASGTCGPIPNARTINLFSAALIQVWIREGPVMDPIFAMNQARQVRWSTKGWRKKKRSRLSFALHPEEWKLVETAVQSLIAEHPDIGLPPKVRLPLGGHGFELDASGSMFSRNAASASARARLRLRSEREAERAGVETHINEGEKWMDPLDVEYPDLPRQLLIPMMVLAQRALRLSLSRRHHVETEEEMVALCDQTLQQVHAEIFPREPLPGRVREEAVVLQGEEGGDGDAEVD